MSAIELNLDERIELVETLVAPCKENTTYANQVNPLRKIPALETDDGSVVLDSSVICEYLNELEGGNRLIPASGSQRWKVQTDHAIANGIMDAAVTIRYETFLRPEEHRWAQWVEDQWGKISSALVWLDKKGVSTLETVDDISLACALGYLDFRFAEFPWRANYSNLAQWHDTVATRPSYVDTAPE
jgi:glutathione S-transferase